MTSTECPRSGQDTAVVTCSVCSLERLVETGRSTVSSALLVAITCSRLDPTFARELCSTHRRAQDAVIREIAR